MNKLVRDKQCIIDMHTSSTVTTSSVSIHHSVKQFLYPKPQNPLDSNLHNQLTFVMEPKKRGRKRAVTKPTEEVVFEQPQDVEEEDVEVTKKTTVTKKAPKSATNKKKQKVTESENVAKESTYDIVERLLMDEKSRDFDLYTSTVEKLKKLFDKECLNVDAYNCGKEFLKKFKMPTKQALKKIMDGFKCTEYDVVEQRGHDSLVERVVCICEDEIEIKLQSSMYDYETQNTCFVYANGATFRVDEEEELCDIFEKKDKSRQKEFEEFFKECKEVVGNVTSEELKTLLTSIVSTLGTIWV